MQSFGQAAGRAPEPKRKTATAIMASIISARALSRHEEARSRGRRKREERCPFLDGAPCPVAFQKGVFLPSFSVKKSKKKNQNIREASITGPAASWSRK